MSIRNAIVALALILGLSSNFVASAQKPKVAKKPAYSPANIAKGRLLFKQLQCTGCHTVDNAGACLAPQLDGVTDRRSEDYLMLRLSSAKGDEDRFIKRIGHAELVQHPRFPREQVKFLIAYLSTLKSSKKR